MLLPEMAYSPSVLVLSACTFPGPFRDDLRALETAACGGVAMRSRFIAVGHGATLTCRRREPNNGLLQPQTRLTPVVVALVLAQSFMQFAFTGAIGLIFHAIVSWPIIDLDR